MLDAALIAGGRSRRFGRDKAFALWRGEALWLVQIRKLLQIKGVNQVWLSTNRNQTFPDEIEGVVRINDEISDIGPLAAFKSLFQQSQADHILILAVDMPMIEREDLESLVTGPCLVPKREGRWEPLAGIYPRVKMLPLIDQQIATGELSLQKLLDLAEKEQLIVAKSIPDAQKSHYANLNTPEEYSAIVQGTVDDCTLLSRYKKGVGFSPSEPDFLAREEPLEVRVNGTSVAVMMRTPGHDNELATGFLFTEGLITSAEEILDIEHCPDVDPEGIGNTLNVRLSSAPDLDGLTRHVFTSSSCGVCGKATIESVFQNFPPISRIPSFDPEIILTLPEKLRARQDTFERTGGLHASALFSLGGDFLHLREDVGRHNALDKVIGKALCDKMDLTSAILLVSGRVSFELMQKALAAKIPIVAGISAPSSLAVELSRKSGQVLIGFLRERGFNLY